MCLGRVGRGNINDLAIENRIASDNYSETDGWAIFRDGRAFFGAASIRGKLTAAQIDADVRNWEEVFSGFQTVDQQTRTTLLTSPAAPGEYLAAMFSYRRGSVHDLLLMLTFRSSGVTNVEIGSSTSSSRVLIFTTSVRTQREIVSCNVISPTQVQFGINRGAMSLRNVWHVRGPAGGGVDPLNPDTGTNTGLAEGAETVYRRASSTPSAPSGGTTAPLGTVPSGWQSSRPTATSTQGVYSATRTVTLNNGVFQSSTNWGGVVRVLAPSGGTGGGGVTEGTRTFGSGLTGSNALFVRLNWGAVSGASSYLIRASGSREGSRFSTQVSSIPVTYATLEVGQPGDSISGTVYALVGGAEQPVGAFSLSR